MANLVVHFEIHASEPQRLVDFYGQLLGWKFTQYGEMPYWSIDTGEGAIGNTEAREGLGINGGLTQRQGPKPEPGAAVNGCNIVVGVDNVDQLMSRGLELGAHPHRRRPSVRPVLVLPQPTPTRADAAHQREVGLLTRTGADRVAPTGVLC